MNAIQCTALCKTYPGRPPVEAVRGLDLEVQVGECFGLLGPNGAGKTTTLEILEGLLEPTSGQVELLGLQWSEHEMALRQRIGISLQETRLSDKLTVRETLTLFRSFYPMGLTPEEAMEQVSLTEKARSYSDKLSGGQRQRLAVACALVGDPELIFLDEPTTGLDPQSRRQLWDVIRGFRERGRTVMITTHYMDEAERLCDRVAIVDQGQVIALGTPRELITRIGGEQIVDFRTATSAETGYDLDSLRSIPTAGEARRNDDRISLTVREPHAALPGLLELLQKRGETLTDLTIRSATLEDVFVTLTGRNLRDE